MQEEVTGASGSTWETSRTDLKASDRRMGNMALLLSGLCSPERAMDGKREGGPRRFFYPRLKPVAHKAK